MAVQTRARSIPCLATIKLAMQSGTLVPAARKVIPMMTSGIPSVYPMIVTCRREGWAARTDSGTPGGFPYPVCPSLECGTQEKKIWNMTFFSSGDMSNMGLLKRL